MNRYRHILLVAGKIFGILLLLVSLIAIAFYTAPLINAEAGLEFDVGGKIAFTSDRTGNKDIFIANVNGGGFFQLTSDPADDFSPLISPDGLTIAFSSTRGGQQDIYLMNLDGSNVRQLTNDDAIDTPTDWTPDSQKIALSSTRDGAPLMQSTEIYVMNADGLSIVRLTNNNAVDKDAHWSPDGQKLIFSSDRDGDYELYTMDSDGSNVQRLTYNPGIDDQASWSPDGGKIAFRSDRNGILSVYSMNVDGSDLKSENQGYPGDQNPDWDSGSPFYAYASKGTRSIYQIFLYLAEGRSGNGFATGPYTSTSNDTEPSWWHPRFAVGDGDLAGLISAINSANDEETHPGADLIDLAPNANYTLTSTYETPMVGEQAEPSGLPFIRSMITIFGNHSTLKKESNEFFRHLTVTNNALELNDLSFIGNPNGTLGNGGGIYSEGGQLFLNNCVFENNSAVRGGAILNFGAIEIHQSTFRQNKANEGGAIYAAGGGISYFTQFESNEATNVTSDSARNGGAIYILESELEIIEGSITNNTAENGGGIYVQAQPPNGSATLGLHGTFIANNSATNRGGGIYSRNTELAYEKNEIGGGVFHFAIIQNNSAMYGGAIYIDGGTGYTDRAVFSNNHAAIGGGIYAQTNDALSIFESSFVGNVAISASGGGIYYAPSNDGQGVLTLMGNQLTANSAAVNGGALYTNGLVEALAFCENIFQSNTASAAGSAIYHGVNPNFVTAPSAVQVTDNCFVDNSGQSVTNEDTSSLDYANNWWGAIDGPRTSTSSGSSGDAISDYISYEPFASDPLTLVFPSNLTSITCPLASSEITETPTETVTATNTSSLTPTSTVTPDGGSFPPSLYGNGHDGDVIVVSGQTLYTDTVWATLTSTAPIAQNHVNVSNITGFVTGDEVIIVQMLGPDAGRYEFARIAGIQSGTLILQQLLTFSFNVDSYNKTQIIRVPNYHNVTVESGGLVAPRTWDGMSGGIIAFRANGTLTVESGGIISANGAGYRGANLNISNAGFQGESASGAGMQASATNGMAGGGGCSLGFGNPAGGGGGGHGEAGQSGNPGNNNNCNTPGSGGNIQGDSNLDNILLGGGGGSGGGKADGDSRNYGGGGGAGGGIVMTYAQNVQISGGISSFGADGQTGYEFNRGANGGGGAGGSILLVYTLGSVNSGLLTVNGGQGGRYNGNPPQDGGNGGNGIIRIVQDFGATETPTPTSTDVPTVTSTATPSDTPSSTFTPTSTDTLMPSSTPTFTSSPSDTFTPSPTFTNTSTDMPTATVSPTETTTATVTPTFTDMPRVTSISTANDSHDINPGDGICADVNGFCSLRAAIEEANALSGPDSITIPAGTYTLTLGSELYVTSEITINGAGAETTIIQANVNRDTANYRVLNVIHGGIATLNGLDIRYGKCDGACVTSPIYGGGIYNAGTLLLDSVIVDDNIATTYGSVGGGLYNSGTLTIRNGSLIGGVGHGNLGYGGAGGIYNVGLTTIDNSTISANYTQSSGAGGGIYNDGGTLVVQNGGVIGGVGAGNMTTLDYPTREAVFSTSAEEQLRLMQVRSAPIQRVILVEVFITIQR